MQLLHWVSQERFGAAASVAVSDGIAEPELQASACTATFRFVAGRAESAREGLSSKTQAQHGILEIIQRADVH